MDNKNASQSWRITLDGNIHYWDSFDESRWAKIEEFIMAGRGQYAKAEKRNETNIFQYDIYCEFES